jgi:UDP-N-acetylglucosamine acyltransferase
MANIHPTALVDPRAEIADDVIIGAFSIVKGPVQIGAGTVLHEHTHIHGLTVIGSRCELGPTAFIGLKPQHLKADPNIGELVIGNDVTIRETATVHRSIVAGREHATRVGDKCFIMGGVHIAHDCDLGHGVIVANGALIAGHCQIADKAFLGGGCALHQFVRVGRLAIIGGNEPVSQEVLPFAAIRNGGMRGYNAIGCRRSGMTHGAISAVRAAYRSLHLHRLIDRAIEEILQNSPIIPEVQELLDFIASAKRGIVPSVGGRRGVFDAVENQPTIN